MISLQPSRAWWEVNWLYKSTRCWRKGATPVNNQILSQEEIDALLKGNGDHSLTAFERDALGEIGNIAFGAAATALSSLLNRRIELNTPNVDLVTMEQLRQENPGNCVMTEVDYKKGLVGSNFMILQMIDAAIIADLMMGGDGSNPKSEINEMELSAVGEAMNVMMGSASTSMSTLFARRVEIDPPRVYIKDLTESDASLAPASQGDLVRVSFQFFVEELIDSRLMLLIPLEFAREMAGCLSQEFAMASAAAEVAEVAETEPVQEEPPKAAAPPPPPATEKPASSSVVVQPVQFTPITPAPSSRENGNIGLLMDVMLQLSVELGGTRMKIKDILELGIGSIVELDRLAGEPVDILVNGKLIAKGEVVVIDENFGVKVTDILNPIERVNSLQ
ncbi:MAG TPA: flagellar motor switch phosphatase FliY [Firmicutes bacterium]|nr:flagellar motor switch phosphatase FliY [Bacillota bacterium]